MTILVYRLGSLGDTVLALPTLRRLRQLYAQDRILLLTNFPESAKAAPMAALLDGAGIVDEVFAYPLGGRDLKRLLSLVRQLRGESIDTAVHLAASRGLAKSLRDWLFLKLCGARTVVGVPWRKADLCTLPDPNTPGFHEWEAVRIARRLVALSHVDLDDDTLWNLRLTNGERDAAGALLSDGNIDGGFIAASVGTKADTKDWTQVNWSKLLSRVHARYSSLSLVLLGSLEEQARSDECITAWSGRALNLCGRTSPRIAAALLQRAKLFVGHDSGPMHLAGGVGTPCVAIFSARNLRGTWYPRGGERNRILYHHVPCEGCGLSECVQYGKKCILSITCDEVFSAVQELLERTAD